MAVGGLADQGGERRTRKRGRPRTGIASWRRVSVTMCVIAIPFVSGRVVGLGSISFEGARFRPYVLIVAGATELMIANRGCGKAVICMTCVPYTPQSSSLRPFPAQAESYHHCQARVAVGTRRAIMRTNIRLVKQVSDDDGEVVLDLAESKNDQGDRG